MGYGASTAEASFVLPADPLSPDPTVSRFTATVTLGYSGMPGIAFGPLAARSLPPPLDYVAPSIETLHLELDRTFDGILDLGTVGGPAGGRFEMFNTAVIDPSDDLEEEAVLWLVCDGFDERTIGVRDDRGEAWQAEAKPLEDGRLALRFAPTTPGTIKNVSVFWRLGVHVGVLGLGGISAAARRAAKARQDARDAEAARQAAAAAAQPQPAATTTGAETRCVLKPGKLYRLDVDMTWSGELYEQKEDGSKVEVDSKADETTYEPKGGGDPSTKRSFFFRTTPKPVAAAPSPIELMYGTEHHLTFLHRRQDLFDRGCSNGT